MALLLLLGLAPANQAENNLVSSPYDWVINLKTQALERQFDYHNSTLKKIEKIEIEYHPTNEKDNLKTYEFLWYNKGRAYGMEKKRKFDIPKGEGVALKITHAKSNPSNAEYKAAANAILRTALDTYLNKNPIVQVRLPETSFDNISQELINLGMKEAPPNDDDFSGGFSATLTLYLYGENDDTKKVVYL